MIRDKSLLFRVVYGESKRRRTGPQGKYKNSRSTILFNKSYELYHLDKAKQVAKKTHELYLMEGFMDVIAAYRAGIENAVASMGTALTREHVKHLSRFTKKVILTYDGDKAGRLATAKALDILEKQTVEIVQIPDQMDPDEYLQKNSPQALADLLEKLGSAGLSFSWIIGSQTILKICRRRSNLLKRWLL